VKKNRTYIPRTYRSWVQHKDLVSFTVVFRETDLHISACKNLEKEALDAVIQCRAPLERYIEHDAPFLYALEPYPIADDAPAIVKDMANAAEIAHVGPMAAVAGAIAEAVGNELLRYSAEIIIENGGDIFLKTSRNCRIGIYAGESSPFTGKLALEIKSDDMPLGVCTSSGTVGHSLSFGESDAVAVLSRSTSLADAAATALGNRHYSRYRLCTDDPRTNRNAYNQGRQNGTLGKCAACYGLTIGCRSREPQCTQWPSPSRSYRR
jgi:ApbE superfamily uncharacterized protein (UPF0280 family)